MEYRIELGQAGFVGRESEVFREAFLAGWSKGCGGLSMRSGEESRSALVSLKYTCCRAFLRLDMGPELRAKGFLGRRSPL